jgi:hypothetical protein
MASAYTLEAITGCNSTHSAALVFVVDPRSLTRLPCSS